MDEKDWKILFKLYEEKSLTKTAEKLYISQPAISYRIKQIEVEFNTKIILRGKKGIEFTPQGDSLVKYSENMLSQLRKIKEDFQKLDKKVSGTLRLGVSSNFARYELSPLLKEFLNQYPDVEFNVKTGLSDAVIQLLQKEDIHIAITRGDHNWPGVMHLLKQEPLFIASKEPIHINDLPQLGRINYRTDHHLRTDIDNWWEFQFTKPPLITMEVDRIETCKEMVKNGLGYGIFPSISLKDDDDLFKIPLAKNGEIILRKTSLLFRRNSLELSVVHAFAEFLKNHYSEQTQLNEKDLT